MVAVEDIEAGLRALADRFEGRLAVYAKDLGSGRVAELAADAAMPTASCIKLFILLALMRRVEAGAFALDAPLTMRAEDRVGGSGILKTLSPGLTMPMRDVASLMITLSDNTATNMIVDLMGLDGVNREIAALGFAATRLVNRIDFAAIGGDITRLAVSTARDFGRALEGLADGTILSAESCGTVLGIMRRQHYADLIPRYIAHNPYAADLGDVPTLTIANKTGFFPGFRGDVALLESGRRRVVIAVLAADGTDRGFQAENAVAQLVGRVGALVWEGFGRTDLPG